MAFLFETEQFVIGVPKEMPRIPEGWMLRTSVYDFAAAISPDHVEWIIDSTGLLHEVSSVEMGGKPARRLTGKTQRVEPPYGSGSVNDSLPGRVPV